MLSAVEESFSYLTVLLSIVLGLAITQVLLGARGLILTRAKVKLQGLVNGHVSGRGTASFGMLHPPQLQSRADGSVCGGCNRILVHFFGRIR